MKKLRRRRLVLVAVLLAVVLAPAVALARTVCNKYSDGCTICDFYNAKNEWVGYIEWCN